MSEELIELIKCLFVLVPVGIIYLGGLFIQSKPFNHYYREDDDEY